jgi:hypothetical protein
MHDVTALCHFSDRTIKACEDLPSYPKSIKRILEAETRMCHKFVQSSFILPPPRTKKATLCVHVCCFGRNYYFSSPKAIFSYHINEKDRTVRYKVLGT